MNFLKNRSIIWGVGFYGFVWLVVLLIAVVIGFLLYGENGAGSAVVGGVTAGIAGLVALQVMVGSVLLKQPIVGVLGGMLVRMGVALGGVFVLPEKFPGLVSFGLIPIFLAVYMAVLASETMISLSWIHQEGVHKG